MSIRFVAEAFRKGLDGKASCSSATMKYERDDDTGKERQVLTFYVQPARGDMRAFTHKIDGSVDPVSAASIAAKQFLETLEGV